jgi:hypothetical protein
MRSRSLAEAAVFSSSVEAGGTVADRCKNNRIHWRGDRNVYAALAAAEISARALAITLREEGVFFATASPTIYSMAQNNLPARPEHFAQPAQNMHTLNV